MIVKDNYILLLAQEVCEYTGYSYGYIKTALKKQRKMNLSTWLHYPHPEDARVKLIDYDRLPSEAKKLLPSRNELINKYNADQAYYEYESNLERAENLKELQESYQHISDYWFLLDKLGNQVKANDLKKAAAWLRLLNDYKTKKHTKKIGYNSKQELREAIISILIKSQLYGFKIRNIRGLYDNEKRWNNAYQTAFEQFENLSKYERNQEATKAALATLIPYQFGNENARRLGKVQNNKNAITLINGNLDLSEWHANTIFNLYVNYGSANKFDFHEIYTRYQQKCLQNNKKPFSLSSIKKFCKRNDVNDQATWQREGFAKFNKKLPQISGINANYALSKGGYDGFQVDFYTDTDGKRIMLTVVAVFDYYSSAITGYSIGLVEDGKMVRDMYRNHLNRWEGKTYWEIESDRFSGNLTSDTYNMFAQTCQVVNQPASDHPTGKVQSPHKRYFERIIQEVNRLCQSIEGWKGTNITSIDKNRKPNPDYMNGASQKEYEQGVNTIIDLINAYNNTKIQSKGNKTRIELFKENQLEKAPKIPTHIRSLLLNQNDFVKIRTGAKIIKEVNRKKHEYTWPDYMEYAHKMGKGHQVRIFYDERDMSSIDVFGMDSEGNDTYLTTLTKTRKTNKAKAEQTEQDLKDINNISNAKQRIIKNIQRKELEIEASTYGIDIGGMDIKEAEKLVKGARAEQKSEVVVDFQERHSEALNTEDAKADRQYYEDALLRDEGYQVPKNEEKEDKERKKKYLSEKYNLDQ